VQGRRGYFTGFGPAISAKAKKAKGKQIRGCHPNRRSSADLPGLAREINPRVQGWINYYGAFYRLIAASGLAVQGTPEWPFCVGRLA